jgi:hypothetical protein
MSLKRRPIDLQSRFSMCGKNNYATKRNKKKVVNIAICSYEDATLTRLGHSIKCEPVFTNRFLQSLYF